jgi:predicted nucleic acid-binding protein
VSRIFFDTNIFIYLFEDEVGRGRLVQQLLDRMEARGDRLLTSTMTVGEILVRPLQSANQKLAHAYESFFRSPDIEVIPFDVDAARMYAGIRQDRTIKPPDAIQLACASIAKTDLFLTNDAHLTKRLIHGVQFVATLETAPL